MVVLHPDGFINTDAKECIVCGKDDPASPYLLLCRECGDDAEDSEIYKEHRRKLETASYNGKTLSK